MKKSQTKSLEHFLKTIDEVKHKVEDLSKFEHNVENLVENLNNPELQSFTWIENSPVCTKIVDLDYNLKYMSKSGVDKLKIDDISQYYGKPYPLSFYSNSFKIPMKECMDKVLRTKATITQEATILDKEGNKLWFESTLIPIKDHEGNIDYLMIISQDISERKNIELQIKESQKFHESLLKTTPDIIYVYDIIEHKNVYMNSGSLNILGYTTNEIKALDTDILPTIMHPKDYNAYKNNILPQYSFLKDGEIIELEYRAKHKKGNWIWLNSRASIFKRIDGKPKQIIGVARDITQKKEIEFDLKKSKEKLKEALEITQLGTFVFDDSVDFFETSTIGDKILGLDQSYKKDIQGWINIVHPEDFQNVQDMLDNPKLSYVALDFRIIRPKDQKTIWISGYARKEFNDKGIRTKITGTFQDVSDRKLADEQLKTAQNNLKNTINLSPSIIAKANLNTGYFIEASPAVERILGFTPKEFTSKPFIEFIYPEDQKRTQEKAKDKLNGNEDFYYENRYLCKNGTYKWMSWQSTIPDKHGIVNTVGSDIDDKKETENSLKESEELLNFTGELAKVGGWELNIKSKTVKWSNETKNIHEVNKNYHPKLEEAINFYHIDDRKLVSNHVSNAIKNKRPYSFEARIITQKGNLKYVKSFGQPIVKKNKCIGLYGAIQDITERKIIELELEEYRKELETKNVLLKKEMSLSFNFKDIVYSSDKMSQVLTMVEQVAKTDANVLILGETGTGKELIAKAIHKISDRKNNSIISVNCSAIPSDLIESELFGHEKGSFTGAINNRLGKFELADGGTLFLDEIGEMPISLQPKLLRAIQEGEIEPVGSTKVKKLNVRIIAATNRDLKQEVKEKRFREDLFFRLNVFPINIPSLRQRIDDIPVLAEYFVNKYSKKYNRNIDYISDINMQQLKYYHWPGNVRELENLIERAVIIADSNILVIPDFSGEPSKIISNSNHKITLKQVQRDHILKTLNDTHWKIEGKNGAAELLDIKPSTLRDRMKKFGIKRP